MNSRKIKLHVVFCQYFQQNPYNNYWYFFNVIQQGTTQHKFPNYPHESHTSYAFYQIVIAIQEGTHDYFSLT